MPYQRSNFQKKATSVTVDRALYDEIIARGYNFSEIVNAAMSAVLHIDDEFSIRYEAMLQARTEISRMQSAKRFTISDPLRETGMKQIQIKRSLDSMLETYILSGTDGIRKAASSQSLSIRKYLDNIFLSMVNSEKYKKMNIKYEEVFKEFSKLYPEVLKIYNEG